MIAGTTWVDGCRRVAKSLQYLIRDRRANVLMIVGLAAPLVFGTAGFAIDYGYASYLKRSLDQAADTASLAATSQSTAQASGGYANVVKLKQWGLNVFAGNTAKLNITVTPNLTVVPNGTGGVVATTTYSYDMPTYFSSFVGIPKITVTGTAVATANPITYIDYYILLDISQSMGIGATATDMTNMYNRSLAYNNHGCVFGCHVKMQAGSGTEPYANETLAHTISPRINLRIDAAVSAIQNIIADAQTAAGSKKNIRIGIYTMSDDPVSGQQLTKVSAPTSDYAGLSTLAAGITLGNNVAGGKGDTNYVASGTQFYSVLPVNGTGITSSSPKNYLFIVTDGVSDTVGSSCTSGHCTAAFDPSNCTYFKSKATLGTIYTTYLPIYNNNDSTPRADGTANYDANYQQLVLPFASQIAPNLQGCATDNTLYYEASDGPTLNASMKALFASTLKTARLTQ